MKITFLGTGGARFAMIDQLRKTGGIFLELDDLNIYIDPGPGALINSIEEGINLKKLDCIIVSHAHLDHYNDAEVLIEAMTNGCTEKRGVFIGNKTVIRGNENNKNGILFQYHEEALKEIIELGEGDKTSLKSYEIETILTDHKNERPICFKIHRENGDGKEIGFLTDSTYMEKLGKFFETTNYLIINCIRPKDKEWEGHLNVKDVSKIIDRSKPEIAILTHFGRHMIFSSIAEQKQWLEENTETDTDIIFARDLQTIDFNGEKKNLNEFIERSKD